MDVRYISYHRPYGKSAYEVNLNNAFYPFNADEIKNALEQYIQ